MKTIVQQWGASSVGDFIIGGMGLIAMCALAFSGSIGVSFAEFVPVHYNDGEVLEIEALASNVTTPWRKHAPDWTIEYRGSPTPEVVGRINESDFCLRIAYGRPGAMFTNIGGIPVVFQGGTADSQASCRGDYLAQPTFNVVVNIPAKTRRYLGLSSNEPVATRILMSIPGELDERVPLQAFQWQLNARNRSGEWVVVGGLNLPEGFTSSYWSQLAESTVRFALVLNGEVGEEVRVAENRTRKSALPTPTAPEVKTDPVAVQYGVKDGLEAPADAFFANGEVWTSWTKVSVDTDISVSWNAELAAPVSMQLCGDSSCADLLAALPVTDNPFTLKAEQLTNDDKAYLIVNWGPPSASVRSVPEPSISQVAIALSPVVAFGSYTRPLTSCIGQLITASAEPATFQLRQGRQELDLMQIPAELESSSPARVVFNVSRAGGDCPAAGLETSELSIAQFQSVEGGSTGTLTLETDDVLFAGYLQLNGAQYRGSLARWRETVMFYDAVYQRGRRDSKWLDGILFGAGERGGIDITIEPLSNFVTVLGDESALTEAAKAMHANTRTSSGLFSEQLAELKVRLGDARVTLLYFDDFPGGCGDYVSDLSASGLRVERALIITAMPDYTGTEDGLRSVGNGLAHVCEDSGSVRAYAFNSKERLLNLDWDRTLAAILEDWYP